MWLYCGTTTSETILRNHKNEDFLRGSLVWTERERKSSLNASGLFPSHPPHACKVSNPSPALRMSGRGRGVRADPARGFSAGYGWSTHALYRSEPVLYKPIRAHSLLTCPAQPVFKHSGQASKSDHLNCRYNSAPADNCAWKSPLSGFGNQVPLTC